jgi:hypothetical protein
MGQEDRIPTPSPYTPFSGHAKEATWAPMPRQDAEYLERGRGFLDRQPAGTAKQCIQQLQAKTLAITHAESAQKLFSPPRELHTLEMRGACCTDRAGPRARATCPKMWLVPNHAKPRTSA